MLVYNTVEDIREYFYHALRQKQYVIDKTGVKTLEVINTSFIADEPAIFGTVNIDYIARELDWYKSKSLSVNDIPGGAPEIWKSIANEHGEINSNYGWCIYSQENGSQYDHVVDELRQNPNSRRAIMIYTRPHMWYDYKFLGMNDFMCTNTVQYYIRNDKLHVCVNMRSNDVVYGYKNDFAWQQYVALQLCDELGIQLGNITWNANSLHVYERHFHLVK
jgi:thymidylate synthase